MGLVNDHLLYGAPVPQAEEACVETFYRLSVLHPNDEDFVNFQEVVVHFVGGFPVYGKGCAGVKYDLELAVVDMIANPKGSRLEGLVMQEVPHNVEDRTVQHQQFGRDRLIADGLGKMTFPRTRRSNEQNVLSLMNELAGGQFVNLLPLDRRVELPVEAGSSDLGRSPPSLVDSPGDPTGSPVHPGAPVPGTRRG